MGMMGGVRMKGSVGELSCKEKMGKRVWEVKGKKGKGKRGEGGEMKVGVEKMKGEMMKD